ncbi:MAG TPA: DUF3142 domain-containing protein [Fimbriimonadaceae bacterium]|nr:DUF3142 domain-containing protein [Fimbriimonadaceae bacterium]
MRWLLALWALVGVASCSRPPTPHLATSFWFWHGPASLDASQQKDLQSIGVKTLYVLGATIAQEDGHLAVVLPQRFEPTGAQDVHLVFRLDGTIGAEFERLDLDALAEKIVNAHARVGAQARAQGWSVTGLQLDFDCPVRLLRRYADLVSRVRDGLPSGTALSVTGLSSWYASSNIEDLAKVCDEIVPQCYEASLGTSLDRLQPVSHLALLERTIERAERLGKPYRIGIPAYGHALLYDPSGKLATTFRRMGPRTISRHPSFSLEQSSPMNAQGKPASSAADWIGEDLLVFRAIKPARDGQGLGFRVAFKVPTPRMVALALAKIRSLRPRHCRGIVVFRIAEPGEDLAVPLTSVASVFQGTEPRPDILVTSRHETIPYPGIERPSQSGPLPELLTIRLENRGKGPTAIRPNAVTLDLTFDAPGNVVSGGDWTLESATGASGTASSLARATRLRLRLPGLLPGEAAQAQIRIEGRASRVTIRTRALLPGGFESVDHELNVEDLREEPRKPQ